MSRRLIDNRPRCGDCGNVLISGYGSRCTTMHSGSDLFFKSKERIAKEKAERIEKLKKQAAEEKKQ